MDMEIKQKINVDVEKWRLEFDMFEADDDEVMADIEGYFEGWCQGQIENLGCSKA